MRRNIQRPSFHMPKIWTECVKEYVDLAKAQERFLNVEEGDRGQDVVTYQCRLCGAEHKGQVVG